MNRHSFINTATTNKMLSLVTGLSFPIPENISLGYFIDRFLLNSLEERQKSQF